MFTNIYEAIMREMTVLEDRYANGVQMTGKDLQDVDLMAHALKCLATYEAMADYDDGYSRPRRGYARRY